MLNLNRASLSLEPINVAINDAIERAAATNAELPRPYLGASIVGAECLRKVQFDWWCKPTLSARVRDIFERGHYFEDVARQHLIAAGFKFAPPEALAFSAVNGCLRGHADGIIIAGPNPLGGAYFNYPFLWEHKATNRKTWGAIERDGLEKAFRNTPRRSRSIRLISTRPTLHCSRSPMPTPANGCTSGYRSPPSVRRNGAIGPPSSSRRPAPASCCRAPTTIRRTGAAACAVTPERCWR